MRGLWRRLERAYLARGPRRMTMGGAFLLAMLALALATHGKFLHPAGYGLGMAAQVVHERKEAKRLSNENTELQEIWKFLQTPEGKELAARAEVMALKPGERLIVLKEAAAKAKAKPQTIHERVQGGLEVAGDWAGEKLSDAREIFEVWSGLGMASAEASTTPAPAKGAVATPAAKDTSKH